MRLTHPTMLPFEIGVAAHDTYTLYYVEKPAIDDAPPVKVNIQIASTMTLKKCLKILAKEQLIREKPQMPIDDFANEVKYRYQAFKKLLNQQE